MTKARFALGQLPDIRCQEHSEPNREMCSLAIREYKRTNELDPSPAEAPLDLAYILYLLDQNDESETYHRKALAISGANPEASCGVAASVGRASVVRHTLWTLSRVLRARLTFSRISFALAVQMNGLG